MVDTYSPDVVIGTESWLKEDIGNAVIFRADFTAFIKDRSARCWGGEFICVKNVVAATELWIDDDFEMIAVEVKGMDPKYTWEITGVYRAANEEMLAIERLAACALPARNLTKRIVIGGDMNSPQAEWKGDAEKASGFHAFVNNLVWDGGYSQAVSGRTRGDVLLDIYLLRRESSLSLVIFYPESIP